MDGYRRFMFLFVLVTTGGCNWSQLVTQYTAPMPRVLPPSPTLEQVVEVVNRNSRQIQSFSTNQAKLTGPGLPTLRASVAWERPKRFRLRAETALTGPEVDLGSNDELFWFWIRRNQPPAVYFARHDQFADSPVRQVIPIEPAWLVEALGITEFDPDLPHQGPFPTSDGRLEIRTIRETAEGPTTKVTIVHPVSGWLLAQHVYDARNRLKASAVASQHRRDPLTGLTLPKVVDIRCPVAQFSMRVELGNVEINRLESTRHELWTMPSYPGYGTVDLCDPNLPRGPAAGPAAVSLRPALPRSSNQLRY